MARDQRTIFLFKCDRCGKGIEYTDSRDIAGTASINGQQSGGAPLVSGFGHNGYEGDLCNECRDSFANWWLDPQKKSA